jgi:hypothetical protein
MQEMSMLGLSDLFVNKDSINLKMYKSYQKIPYDSGEAELTVIVIAACLALVIAIWIVLKIAEENV